MALAGSAVGLGNLWRFPYLVGENGGSAFILIYLGFVLLIGLPIMLCEFLIGRRGGSDSFGSFRALAPGSKWGIVGFLGVLCSFCILSFYSVVGGWGLAALLHPTTFDFAGFSASPLRQILGLLAFLALTAIIVVSGVKNGIERFAKIMMPVLFLLIIIIAVYAMCLPGAQDGIRYIFKPDFSKVTGSTLIAAMGQSFFSLSLGSGLVITFGSYVAKKENILKMSTQTVVADTVFALFASCAIMPAVFAFGVNPGEGPGLVFVTLPQIFAQMKGGIVVAIIFFIAFALAALTSSISLMEVVTAFIIEELHVSRKKAVAFMVVSMMILGSLSAVFSSVFNFFDYVTANILMTVGGLLVVIFVGWKLGAKIVSDEITNSGSINLPRWFLQLLSFLIRFVAPVGIIAIFIANI